MSVGDCDPPCRNESVCCANEHRNVTGCFHYDGPEEIELCEPGRAPYYYDVSFFFKKKRFSEKYFDMYGLLLNLLSYFITIFSSF